VHAVRDDDHGAQPIGTIATPNLLLVPRELFLLQIRRQADDRAREGRFVGASSLYGKIGTDRAPSALEEIDRQDRMEHRAVWPSLWCADSSNTQLSREKGTILFLFFSLFSSYVTPLRYVRFGT
jgi:hypothetical protein